MKKAIPARDSNLDSVQGWLKRSVRGWLLGNAVVLMGMVIADIFVLAMTSWLIYAGLLFGYSSVLTLFELSGRHLPPPDYSLFLPILTICAVIWLFVAYVRTGGEDLSDLPYISRASNPMGPKVWLAQARILLNVLFFCPKLTIATWRLLLKIRRLYQMNIGDCSKVLTLLALSSSGLTFREICQRIANLNPVRIFAQLNDIDGVLFLTGTGKLSLTSDLRNEIRQFLTGFETDEKPFAKPTEEPNVEDPELVDDSEMKNYQVLGVDSFISLEELKKIYRKLMKENHPDLVFQKDREEVKALAEERTKQINEAYHAILAQRNNGSFGR